jgi:hypothetical protein
MAEHSLYQILKLGMNLQHLRSIASVSIIPATSLVAFPNLEENQPAMRCSVRKTVELIRAVGIQLEELGLTKTLAALEPLEPMQKEMQEALSQAPAGGDLILRDHFANTIVEHVKNALLVLKEEAGATMLTI